jgi:hypothetical protein
MYTTMESGWTKVTDAGSADGFNNGSSADIEDFK